MSEPAPTPPPTEADQALVLALAAAIRTAAYFDAENAVMREVGASLAKDIIERIDPDGFLRIGIHSHCVFVGASRMRASVATFQRFASLTKSFQERGINSVTFHPGVAVAEVMSLAQVLAHEGIDGPEAVGEALHARGVRHIDTDLLCAGAGVSAVAPVEAYGAAVELGERLREATESARRVDVRMVRRVTQTLVDQIVEDPAALLALTTMKELDEHLVCHSANVAILAVLLGQRLGLSKTRLGELCLAAFLHDAGKLEVAPEVLEKAGPLDTEEWQEMRKHPVHAARALVGGRRLTTSTMRAVVVAYEHHLNYDMTGYPESQLHDHVSLFGNIVTVADRYDALTTTRVYRRFNFTPQEVLSYLLYYSGTFFDPLLVKLFIEMVGQYPPGTLLQLNTGDVGVVCAPPALGEPLDRPTVRLWTGELSGQTIGLGGPEGHGLEVAAVLSIGDMGQAPAVDLAQLQAGQSRSPALGGPIAPARS
jgi:HD-GYP domain-containing protein (c-di-GMP phosphodiesterase class II)